MGEGRGTAKSELKRRFEEEAAKDHEIVAIAVLGLHYLGGRQDGVRHWRHVEGLAKGIVGVCQGASPILAFHSENHGQPNVHELNQ